MEFTIKFENLLKTSATPKKNWKEFSSMNNKQIKKITPFQKYLIIDILCSFKFEKLNFIVILRILTR